MIKGFPDANVRTRARASLLTLQWKVTISYHREDVRREENDSVSAADGGGGEELLFQNKVPTESGPIRNKNCLFGKKKITSILIVG